MTSKRGFALGKAHTTRCQSTPPSLLAQAKDQKVFCIGKMFFLQYHNPGQSLSSFLSMDVLRQARLSVFLNKMINKTSDIIVHAHKSLKT